MSKDADDTTLQQLTLLPADSLASLIVWPGSKRAQGMTATSGQNIAALLPNSGPLGYLVRMCLESEGLFSMIFYLTWKIWRTPQGRLIYRLAESEPGIDGTDFLSLPTPTAGDSKERSYQYDQGNHKKPRLTLVGIARMYPTPTVDAANERKAKYAQGGQSLSYAVRMYPTPKARDYRTGDRPECKRARMKRTGTWHSPDLNDVAAPGGRLNPTWVEWLMGFPLGWSELDESESEHSEMP